RLCYLKVTDRNWGLFQWEKALSVAPGVSMRYWKKLMQRRADQLMAEDNDDAIPYCIATGDIKKLVAFFTSRGQLLEALLIAQLALASLIRGNEMELAACVGLVLGEAANQSTAYCLELLARKYMTSPTW
ncbi:hypothetical protein XENOCAPTIV_001503, partial [Xenoophorus captivus]